MSTMTVDLCCPIAADHRAKSIATSTPVIQDLRTTTNQGLLSLASAATKAGFTSLTRVSGMIEIQQFPIHPQTQSPQLHTLPASALPLAPQEHLLQTSRNSYRALARWESKKIYQTDSLAWLRCYCRRYQLISKLSPLLYKYLCSAISFYLISLLSPLFYFFLFLIVFFFPFV